MKKIFIVMMVLLMSSMLFAFGSKEEEGVTTITWWAFPTFASAEGGSGAYEREMAAQFMAENPDVKINVEMIDFASGPAKIITAMEGGTAPDVIFDAPGRIISWGKAGYLAPLDDLVAQTGLASDITASAILQASGDGTTTWMYPLSAAAFTMVVSKTALEEAGLYNEFLSIVDMDGDRTWKTDDFVALSKKMAAKGYLGVEIFSKSSGGDQGTRAFIPNLGGATVTNDSVTRYTMDTPEAVLSFELVEQGLKEGWLSPGISSDGTQSITNFTTPINSTFWAMSLWGPGLQAQRTAELEASGIEAIAMPYPSPNGTDTALEYLVNGFCVLDNGNDAKIEASKRFVAWLCDDPEVGPANVLATSTFPVRKSFGNLYAGNPDMEYYSTLEKFFIPYYNTIDGYDFMRPLWFGTLQKITNGEITGAQAAKEFTDGANATL
ncbi:MAG: extracellular solute-binding protein [Spirochaetales bacterium]